MPSAKHRGDRLDSDIPFDEFIAFNTPQKLCQDSSITSVRLAPPMRSQDACLRARVSTRDAQVNHRSSVYRRTVGMSADEPMMSRFLRRLRIRGASGV
jgi:hypothetical protein